MSLPQGYDRAIAHVLDSVSLATWESQMDYHLVEYLALSNGTPLLTYAMHSRLVGGPGKSPECGLYKSNSLESVRREMQAEVSAMTAASWQKVSPRPMARENLVFGAKQVVEDLEEVACTQARQLVTRENAILADAAMREAWELVCSRTEKRPRRHPELHRALRLVLAFPCRRLRAPAFHFTKPGRVIPL